MELSKVGVPPGILQNFSDVSDRSIKKNISSYKKRIISYLSSYYPVIIQLSSS